MSFAFRSCLLTIAAVVAITGCDTTKGPGLFEHLPEQEFGSPPLLKIQNASNEVFFCDPYNNSVVALASDNKYEDPALQRIFGRIFVFDQSDRRRVYIEINAAKDSILVLSDDVERTYNASAECATNIIDAFGRQRVGDLKEIPTIAGLVEDAQEVSKKTLKLGGASPAGVSAGVRRGIRD